MSFSPAVWASRTFDCRRNRTRELRLGQENLLLKSWDLLCGGVVRAIRAQDSRRGVLESNLK